MAGSVLKLPTGTYGGRLGTLVATDFLSVATGYGGLIVSSAVTTRAEFDRALAGMRVDFETPRYPCSTPFYIAIGQRPG